MRRLPVLQLALWLFNATAAMAVVAFTFFYFISPSEPEPLPRWKPKPAPSDPSAGRRSAATYRAIWETPLPVRPQLLVVEGPKPGPVPSKPLLSKLFILTGTFASDDPRAGLAVLTEISTKNTVLVSTNQVVPGTTARVDAIRKDRIIASDPDGRSEELIVKAELPSGAAAGAPGGNPGLRPPVGPRPDGGLSAPALPIDPKSFKTEQDRSNPNLWNVDSKEKQYLMKTLPDLRNLIGVRPVMGSDGNMNGVQVENIHPSSLLRERGIQPGDIIRKVNGVPITSQEQGDQFMNTPSIRNSLRYDIELERAGQVFTITYQVNR
jgi:type II secretion system protein C